MKLSRWNRQPGEEREKVAIIAGDPSYKDAPFDDDTWEIWCCNSMWHLCKDAFGDFRADRWFEMHPEEKQTDEEMKAIQECPVPIYHLGDFGKRQAPNGRTYPIDDILDEFPYRYFTCTFAYQIALALHDGFTMIGLFGVELDRGTSRERMVEKACVEFWIGVALGMGVKVITPEGSRLCTQSKLYGYEYDEEVAEVNSLIDGLFFRRIQELERQGLAERIAIDSEWNVGNA